MIDKNKIWLIKPTIILCLLLSACAPKISSIKPNVVDAKGGADVVIEGKHLKDVDLYVDSKKISVKSQSEEQLIFTAPKHDGGKATVKVENKSGKSAQSEMTYIVTPAMKYIVEFKVTEGVAAARSDFSIFQESKIKVLEKFGIDNIKVNNVRNLPYLIVEDLSSEELTELRNDPDVKAVHENKFRARQTTESLEIIEQPQAYSWGATGEGYSVAVLDTGADYRHPDLGACASAGEGCRVLVSMDMTAVDDGELDADPKQHGTNVSAIIAKTAPKASILSLDVFEPNGAADSDVIKALNWVITNRDQYNIVAVNMSLGSDENHQVECKNTVYDSAFEWLLLDGIQVVVAACTDAVKNGLSIPACHPLAISVGATTDSLTQATRYTSCDDSIVPVDTVSGFSNSAVTLDILAPGTNITAGGVSLSGTSQAAPHVTGALAALKSKFPNRSTAELLLKLQQTGELVTDKSNGVTTRRLNLASAMNDRPIAKDDVAASIEGSGVIIDVLANDVDETPELMKIEGVVINDGMGMYARIIKNKVYFYSDPGVSGLKTIRYSMKDEYGSLATAKITIDIKPFSLAAPRTIAKPSFLSKLGKQRIGNFIVYETGQYQDREVWYQGLDADGLLSKDPHSISRGAAGILANYLDVSSDENGYTASWITKNELVGSYSVQGVNGKHPYLPKPYKASFDYNGIPRNPHVTVLDHTVVVGWEDARDPGHRYSQSFARNVDNPSPIGNLVKDDNLIGFTDRYDGFKVDKDNFLHFRHQKYKDYIITRKLDFYGKDIWAETQKIPDWKGSPPPWESRLNGSALDYDVVKDKTGFAMAWSHATYAGSYGVSFQRYNNDAIADKAPIILLPELNSMGDVSIVNFDNGNYRVFWNEKHADFSAIVSVSISANGNVGEKNIDYWTDNANAYFPGMIDAMALSGDKYLLSWSNNARELMNLTRVNN